MTRCRFRLATALLAIALPLTAWPYAVVGKLLSKRGASAPGNLNGLANMLFRDSSRVDVALRVVVALALLGALAALLVGVWMTVRGERSGIEVMLSGVYGIAGVMAALTVVM